MPVQAHPPWPGRGGGEKGQEQPNVRPVNNRVAVFFALLKFLHKETKYPPLTVAENDLVVQGETGYGLHDIGVPGKVIPTPGHTGDSISLIMDDGDAFVGDAAFNCLSFLGLRHRPIVVESMPRVLESWDRIIRAQAKTVFPSHGEPFGIDSLARQYQALGS